MINTNMSEQTEFAIDIETCPDIGRIERLPEPKVKYGNTKDSEKRKAKEIEAKEKQLENIALDPFYSRICSYAIYGNRSISKYLVLKNLSDKDESELIYDIFRTIAIHCNPTIITYNGNAFDMRFIYTRAAILGIEFVFAGATPIHFEFISKRYNNTMHIDLIEKLFSYGKMKSLNHVAASVLKEKKIDIDHTKFVEMIENGEGDKIGKYNLQDAKMTYKIYMKFKPLFF